MSGSRLTGVVRGLRGLLAVYRDARPPEDDLGGEGPGVAVVLGTQVLAGGRPSRTLEARVRHAARMYAEGRIQRLVVTGGLGKHPPAEAEVMAGILLSEGVPDGDILMEDEAGSTWDSALLVAGMLKKRGVGEAYVVTDPLHCVRAAAALGRVGIVALSEPVYSSPMWRDPWLRRGQFFRESGALVWYGARHGVGRSPR